MYSNIVSIFLPILLLQGQYQLAIVGESFGAAGAAFVTIGGLKCDFVSSSHVLIVCIVPPVRFMCMCML